MEHVCEGDKCDILRQHLDARKKRTHFFVLYGSETGNSKSIAERVHEQAVSKNLSSKLATLDEYESLGFLEEQRIFCAIIVSTTGNGDAPKGAEKFFRFVKKRTHENTLLKQINYMVLALGDQNYDKFCFVGKTIDTRLTALGANQVHPVVLADEVLGLDTSVEPWIEKLFSFHISQMENEINENHQQQQQLNYSDKEHLVVLSPVLSPSSLEFQNLKLEKETGWTFPKPFQNFSNSLNSIEDCLAKVKRIGPIRKSFPVNKYNPAKTNFKEAKVVKFEYLTSQYENENRKVMKVTLDMSNQQEWNIGDAISIQCPNPTILSLAVAERLQVNSSQIISTNDQNEKITLLWLLSYGVNLATSPDRGFLSTLASHCKNPLDKARMELLSSLGGSEEYCTIIEKQKLSVLEVLNLFPSCFPPIDVFLGALGPEPPPPRCYSIASSPLANPNNFADICFSIVEYPISKDRIVKGVCTNEMEDLFISCPLSTQPTVMAMVKPNPTFKLPADETKPIIMIGPGTGVAPFLGFIQHRPANRESKIQQLKNSNPVCGNWRGGLDFEDELEQADDALYISCTKTPEVLNTIGKSTLYFGCRRAEQDFLFQTQLKEYEENGALTRLRVAFSRCEPKKYVQDLMIEDSSIISDEILNQGAYVYVCGDATKMFQDVHIAITTILTSKGGLSESEAKEYLLEMQKRGRYVKDIW